MKDLEGISHHAGCVAMQAVSLCRDMQAKLDAALGGYWPSQTFMITRAGV